MGIKFEVVEATAVPYNGANRSRYAELHTQIVNLPVGKVLKVAGFANKEEAELWRVATTGGGGRAWRRTYLNDSWQLRTTLTVEVDGEGYVLYIRKTERTAAQ